MAEPSTRESKKRRIVELNYTVDGERGVLLADNVEMKVDEPYIKEDGACMGLKISHSHYLGTKFTNPQNNERVYEFFNSSLKEYVANKKPFADYSNQGVHYIFLSPDYIRIIHGLISFLVFLHSRKFVFSTNFQLDYERNFVVVDDVVKFWRLSLHSKSSSKTRQNKDWRQMLKIIKTNLLGIEEDLGNFSQTKYPPLLSDFFYTMLKFQLPQTNPSFNRLTNHLVLLTHRERLDFIRNCEDKKFGLHHSDFHKFERCQQLVKVPDTWREDLVSASDYVKKSLTYQCLKKKDSNITLISAIKVTLTDEQFRENVRSLYPEGDFRDMLRLSRNLATHLIQVIGKLRKPAAAVRVQDVAIDARIMALFDNQLMDFQNNLFNQNLLDYFM